MATSSLHSVRLPISQLKVRSPLSDKFQYILSLFPKNLAFAFAYGSGAFQQHGHKSIQVRCIHENITPFSLSTE